MAEPEINGHELIKGYVLLVFGICVLVIGLYVREPLLVALGIFAIIGTVVVVSNA